MTIDTEIIQKLAHSGLKTLHSVLDLLEFYDVDTEGGLRNSDTRRLFHRSIQALAQAIQDIRLMAICDDTSPCGRRPMNWKHVIENSFSGRLAKVVSFMADEADFKGDGHAELVGAAMADLAWFAGQFWKEPVKVKLGIVDVTTAPDKSGNYEETTTVPDGFGKLTTGKSGNYKKESNSWIHLDWDFGNTLIVDPEFASFPPYFPMFPKESLALDKSTGLALCAVKRILELHGGALTAHCSSDNLRLELSCPKSNGKRGENYNAAI